MFLPLEKKQEPGFISFERKTTTIFIANQRFKIEQMESVRAHRRKSVLSRARLEAQIDDENVKDLLHKQFPYVNVQAVAYMTSTWRYGLHALYRPSST